MRRPTRWPPLSRVNYDEAGVPTSMNIYVIACAGEPPETFLRRDADREVFVPWMHGTAVAVVPNGCDEPMAFCGPCLDRWRDEAARLARLRKLPPASRAWLAERGLTDWTGR